MVDIKLRIILLLESKIDESESVRRVFRSLSLSLLSASCIARFEEEVTYNKFSNDL